MYYNLLHGSRPTFHKLIMFRSMTIYIALIILVFNVVKWFQ